MRSGFPWSPLLVVMLLVAGCRDDSSTSTPCPCEQGVADSDHDGVPDAVDLCPELASPDNTDTDGDKLGDPCDPDDDNDGASDEQDNCPKMVNPPRDCDGDEAIPPEQCDNDYDGQGDECDPDDDNDGIADEADNCPLVANSDQQDSDHDGVGDACAGR